ncbi:hypothetical protein Tco_0883422, partial [Tanacetum coccineum]
MSKPLPLQDKEDRLVILVELFFNNDLEYLTAGNKERTYSSSITKAPAARYTMEGIEDMIPISWSPIVLDYDKMLSVVSLQVEKKYGYGYLKEIVVRRANQNMYKFKEGDFSDLHLNDIEDMMLLVAQNKLFNLDGDVIVDFVIALKMFNRGISLNNKVKDVHLGVESYQRKLNLTSPQRSCPGISAKELYTSNYDP